MTGFTSSPEFLRWKFEVDEVSAGVYRARGVDEEGRTVEAVGTDPEALLAQCRSWAAQIEEAKAGR